MGGGEDVEEGGVAGEVDWRWRVVRGDKIRLDRYLAVNTSHEEVYGFIH